MGRLRKSLGTTFAILLSACAASPASAPVAAPALPAAPPSPEAVREGIEAGRLDLLVAMSRARLAEGRDIAGSALVAALASFADGDLPAARAAFARQSSSDPLSLYLNAFLTAAEGDPAKGVFLVEDAPGAQDEQRIRVLSILEELAGRPEKALAYAYLLQPRLPTPPVRDRDATATVESVTSDLQAWRTSELLFRRGLLEQRAGQKAAAEASFRSALDYTPNDLGILDGLARLRAGLAPRRPPLTPRTGFALVLSDIADANASAQFLAAALSQNLQSLEQAGYDEILRLFAARFAPGATDLELEVLGDLSVRGRNEALLARIRARKDWAPFARTVAALEAEALLALERREEALMVAQAAAQGPLQFREAINLANVLSRLGHEDSALALLDPVETPIAGAHDRAELFAARAGVLRQAGRYGEAVVEARASAAAAERRDSLSYLAGLLAEHPPTWAEGVALHRSLVAQREDAGSLNGLAWAVLQDPAGDLDEAHRLAVRAVANSPTSFANIDTLGWSYYLHGDFLSARREISRALELAGADAPAELHGHLGDIYWRLDRKEDARASWRKALDASPDRKQRAQIEAKLQTGLTTPAPAPRPIPEVSQPEKPRQRNDI